MVRSRNGRGGGRPGCKPLGRRAGLCVAIVLAFALLAVALQLGVAIPDAKADDTSAAGSGDVAFRIGHSTNINTINPFLCHNAADLELLRLQYSFLLGFEPKRFDLRPELATEVPTKENGGLSEDGLTWTFHIREGVKWTDGQPLTAKDVVFTYSRLLEIYPINPMLVLTRPLDNLESVTATDDYTVVFKTSVPKANMLVGVVASTPIVPEHVWSKIPVKDVAGTYEPTPPLVCSGMFQVVGYEHENYVNFAANKDYWDGAPKIDKLDYLFYTNANTLATDLETGAIDAAKNIPGASFESLEGKKGITANAAMLPRITNLAINCYDSPASKGNPALLDPKFRQALLWGIDHDKIVEIAWNGYAVPAIGLFPPNSPFYWQPSGSDVVYNYDPEKSKSVLDELGYKDGNGDGLRETPEGKPLTLRLFALNEASEDQTIVKLLAGMWKDIGLDIKVSIMDFGPFAEKVWVNATDAEWSPDYDMLVLYETQVSLDPSAFLKLIGTDEKSQYGGTQYHGWVDPQFVKLLAEQAAEMDPQKRLELVHEMARIAYEAPGGIVALDYPPSLEAWNSDKWEGFVGGPLEAGADVKPLTIFNWFNVDTYHNVHLKEAASGGESEAASGGGLGAGAWVGIVIAAVVVIGGITFFAMRRRRAETE